MCEVLLVYVMRYEVRVRYNVGYLSVNKCALA